MKCAKVYVCLACCLCAAAVFSAEPSAFVLQQKAEQALNQAQLSGLSRFNYMRFYPGTNQLPKDASLWDRLFSSAQETQEARALAIYLYNMFVSARTYGDRAGKISLNYLGVLDGLALAQKPLHSQSARAFYAKHKKEIDAQMTYFLNKTHKNWAAPTSKEYEAWLTLLEKQPLKRKQVVYTFPAQNLLQATLPTNVKTHFRALLHQANAQAGKHVIVYDVPDVKLEDLDSKFGNNHSHRKRTYRWIKDECYYSAYLLGKQVNQAIISRLLPWNTRVYLLTAYPKDGAFLLPAQGKRFTLSTGKPSAHWQYHTVLLAIVPHEGTFVPVVLDPFLGGNTPLTWKDFLAKFHTTTAFSAVPFRRNNTVEQAIKIPQKLQGTTVWVDRNTYEPAPIEQ